MFQIHRGENYVDNQVEGYGTIEHIQILSDEKMRGKLLDILVHARWSHKSEGFFRVYVNGITTPSYSQSGPTKSKGKRANFKFGIYQTHVSRWGKDTPNLVVYYDAVKKAKSCRKATKFFDCERIQ